MGFGLGDGVALVLGFSETSGLADLLGLEEGFIKIISRRLTGIVIGGVVVAPEASELILPIAVAVQNRLTVKDLAYTFSVYPSLSGSITELGAPILALLEERRG